MNRCVAGTALHIGGPALKAAAAKALNGTDTQLATALEGHQQRRPALLPGGGGRCRDRR
ncbi:hypothetical protein ABZ322_03410 [Streptomyces sp. NPDC006129]